MLRCLIILSAWIGPIFILIMWPKGVERLLVRLRGIVLKGLLFLVALTVPFMLFWRVCVAPVAHWWLEHIGQLSWNTDNFRICLFWSSYVLLIVLSFGFWILWVYYRRHYHFNMHLENNMLSHDMAISLETQDLFNRTPFVQLVQDVILRANVGSGAEFIGVFGSWGAGKTSVVNLIQRAMSCPSQKDSNKRQALFVDFNAWSFANSTDAIAGFLRQIVTALQVAEEKRAAKAFESFGQMNGLRQISLRGGILGDVLDVFRQWYFMTLYNERRVLQRVKIALRDMVPRLVVVVDDLERMPSDDVGRIVSFLKANFDLPNVIVLFISDRIHLTQSIAKYIGHRWALHSADVGASYLEKIIPYQLDLPKIRLDELMRFFVIELKKLFSEKDGWRYDFDHDDGNDYETVRPLVKTIRDARRLLNAVWARVAYHKNATRSQCLNLHIGDLVALTALKVWFPEVYDEVHSLIERFLTEWNEHFMSGSGGLSEEELNRWIDRYGKDPASRELIWEFLKKRLGVEMIGSRDGKKEYVLSGIIKAEEPRFMFRLSSPDYFELYFEDFSNVVYVQKSDIMEFDDQIAAKNIPKDLFVRLHKDGMLPQMINTLMGQSVFPSEDMTIVFFKALLWLANQSFMASYFRRKDEAVYDIYKSLGRCVYLYMVHYVGGATSGVNGAPVRFQGYSPMEAGRLLLRAAKEIPSCFIIWQFLSWEKNTDYKQSGVVSQLFADDDYEAFIDLYLENIIKLQREGILFASPVFFDLMRAWNISLKRRGEPVLYGKMQQVLRDSLDDIGNVIKLVPFLERSEVYFEKEFIRGCVFMGIDVSFVRKFFGRQLLERISETFVHAETLPDRIKLLSYALIFVLDKNLNENFCDFKKQTDYVRKKLEKDKDRKL